MKDKLNQKLQNKIDKEFHNKYYNKKVQSQTANLDFQMKLNYKDKEKNNIYNFDKKSVVFYKLNYIKILHMLLVIFAIS